MIQLRIHNESELYNPFDPSQTRISDSVYEYLKSFCLEGRRKVPQHDTLQIISDGPVDADRFRQALREAVRRDRETFDSQISRNRKGAINSCAIGIVLSVIGVTLSILLDQVLLAIISFLGTSSVNDSFRLCTRVIPDIKLMKKRLDLFDVLDLEVVRQ